MADERTTPARTSDARLHAYFDGELSPAEAIEVRERVEADPRLRAKLEGLGEVRALVRASVAPALDELPSDDLWARIEAGIAPESGRGEARPVEKGAAEARPGLRVIAGGGASESERAHGPSRRSADDSNRRRRVVGVVIAGLALAAAVLLLVLRPGEPAPGTSPDLIATGGDDLAPGGFVHPDAVDPAAAPETAEELVFRTEVLEVDFGTNSGAVFSVEGDDGEHYAVVWLADVQPKRTAER